MSHKAYKFWNPEVGKTYHIRILGEAPNYGQHWIKNDGMTPEQRKAKRLIDAISKSPETISWLDRAYFGKTPYCMPGTTLPAYRYSFITNKNQSATKELAMVFERDAREAGYPIRACAHLTHSLDGRSTYWKVEAYFPVHSFKDKA